MRPLSVAAFLLGSAALVAAHQVVERRTEGRRRRRPGLKGVPVRPVPAPLPWPPGPPPGDVASPKVEEVPTCPPGQVVVPYEGGWFCIDPPPQAPKEGGPCEDEGAWDPDRDLECVGGFWQEPRDGRLCATEGLDHDQLHCADGHWRYPEHNVPCHPSGRFTRDETLHCVDRTWQPAADGRPCRVPGQYNRIQSLYCGSDQRWHAVAEGSPCPTNGARGPGRRDLVCYENEWRKVIKCAAAAAACGAVPIPGLPRFHCWSASPGAGRCD